MQLNDFVKLLRSPINGSLLIKINNELYDSERNKFQIRNDIPRFVDSDNYSNSFGYQWNLHNKTQLDSYTKLPISYNRLFSVTNWNSILVNEIILEAGSGAGRFTEVLLNTGAEVFSFDYSNAIEANKFNNGSKPNLNLFQGDIYAIPFSNSFFDKIICFGVLQHTPDPEKAFKNLCNYLKPEAEIAIDIYRADIISFFQWKYLLRPITKRMDKIRLYKIVSVVVPILLPITKLLRKYLGKIGARISPIVEYSFLG